MDVAEGIILLLVGILAGFMAGLFLMVRVFSTQIDELRADFQKLRNQRWANPAPARTPAELARDFGGQEREALRGQQEEVVALSVAETQAMVMEIMNEAGVDEASAKEEVDRMLNQAGMIGSME